MILSPLLWLRGSSPRRGKKYRNIRLSIYKKTVVQILTIRTCAKTSSASRSFLETLLASILSPQTAILTRWHNLDYGHPGGGHDDGDDHSC